MNSTKKNLKYWIISAMVFSCLFSTYSWASDHGEGHIGDYYIFKRGVNLVMVMTIVADIPADPKTFKFPSDITYKFLIDRNAKISLDDADAVKMYGGIVLSPSSIREDVTIEIKFNQSGQLEKAAIGLRSGAASDIKVFAGITDDPFIRGGLDRKNIAALVVELPLKMVINRKDKNTFLSWGTTNLKHENDEMHDLGGHPYRSQTLKKLNTLHPSQHMKELKVNPDVYIYNSSKMAKFPNGRDLIDDVVNMLPDHVVKPNAEDPLANDVEFLDDFPYLPPPHSFEPGDLPGPHSDKIYNAPLAVFDLGSEIGMTDRKARIRYWIMSPGGIIGHHFHEGRPAYVYLTEGEVIETKANRGDTTITTLKGNESVLEPTNINHWWVNDTKNTVKMVAVDIPEPEESKALAINILYGVPRNPSNPLIAPTDPDKVKIVDLGFHDLGKLFPEIEAVKYYKMRGRRMTILPGQKTPLEHSKGRPAISYVLSGDILEHRSDLETMIRRSGDFSLATNEVSYYWENPTSEPVELLVIDFFEEKAGGG